MTTHFTPPYPLNTPVLFLVFNRPDTTRQVFEAIREAKPPRLYIAADGPRSNKAGEAEKCTEVRKIATAVDWPCQVRTLFRDQNLGCKMAVSGAITWFFEQEEQGIILEDDCLPNQSFFWFCEELLNKYKDDERIGHIGGSNFQNGIKRGDASYYFSIYSFIWGWASWANRWVKYNTNLDQIEKPDFLYDMFKDKRTRKYWHHIFDDMKQQKIDTWDYQWVFSLWYNNQLSIVPNVNLISNIGFGADATKTKRINKLTNVDRIDLGITKHPKNVIVDMEADAFISKTYFVNRKFYTRFWKRIKENFL